MSSYCASAISCEQHEFDAGRFVHGNLFELGAGDRGEDQAFGDVRVDVGRASTDLGDVLQHVLAVAEVAVWAEALFDGEYECGADQSGISEAVRRPVPVVNAALRPS